jgi:hypothetical protein
VCVVDFLDEGFLVAVLHLLGGVEQPQLVIHVRLDGLDHLVEEIVWQILLRVDALKQHGSIDLLRVLV